MPAGLQRLLRYLASEIKASFKAACADELSFGPSGERTDDLPRPKVGKVPYGA